MGAYTRPALAVVGAEALMGVIGTGALAGAFAVASSGGVHRRGVLHVSVVFPYCEMGLGREEGDLKRGRGMFPSIFRRRTSTRRRPARRQGETDEALRSGVARRARARSSDRRRAPAVT